MLNGEEKRVLREAIKTVNLAKEDCIKFSDPVAASQRFDVVIALLASIAAGEVKAKR